MGYINNQKRMSNSNIKIDLNAELVDYYSVNDKEAVFTSIKERQGEQISIDNISYDSGVRRTHVQFIVNLLEHWGYIKRVCILNMGPRYKRFTFVIVKEYDGYTEYDPTEEYSLHANPMVATRRE